MTKRASYETDRIWVHALVFLSAVSACHAQSRDRSHMGRTILNALENPEFINRNTSRVIAPSTPFTECGELPTPRVRRRWKIKLSKVDAWGERSRGSDEHAANRTIRGRT